MGQNKSENPSPPDPLLRVPQILEIIPIGRSTWWKWVKEGKAPAGIKLSARTTVWRQRDIQSLIERL